MSERRDRFASALQRYLDTVALTRRPATVEVYRTAVEDFVRHLQTTQNDARCFSEVRRRHVENWFRYLAQKQSRRGGPLRPATKRRYLTKLRGFFEDIRDWGWDEAPPEGLIQKWDLPPLDLQLPKALAPEADQSLQKHLRAKGGLLPNALLLLRATGMRIGELLNLEVDSLQAFPNKQWSIRVPLGKLHSERYVPADEETAEIFEEIRRLRGQPPPIPHPDTQALTHFLVTWPDGSRPHRNGLCNCLRRTAKRIGLTERIWPHRLRHTYATDMIRAGMSLPVLMRILGHRSASMTMRYIQVTLGDTRLAYLTAVETVKARYTLPELPSIGKDLTQSRTKGNQFVNTTLTALAAELERHRRDHSSGSTNKKLKRLVERLRRLAKDLKKIEL